MNRNEKKDLVAFLKDAFQKSSLVVVARQSGLSVAEATDLRNQMRNAGGSYKIAKNTLAKLAIAGTDCEGLNEHLKGPTSFGYSEDPIAAAKVLVKYASKNDKLQVVAGVLNGKVMSAAEVTALGNLPSMDELRAKIIAVIQTPASQIARVLSAYSEKE